LPICFFPICFCLFAFAYLLFPYFALPVCFFPLFAFACLILPVCFFPLFAFACLLLPHRDNRLTHERHIKKGEGMTRERASKGFVDGVAITVGMTCNAQVWESDKVDVVLWPRVGRECVAEMEKGSAE